MEVIRKKTANLKSLTHPKIMVKRFFIVLGFIMSLSAISYSQTQDAFLKGKVTNGKSGEAVGFAGVQLFQNDIRVAARSADENGNYVLGPVQPGTYDLKVKA